MVSPRHLILWSAAALALMCVVLLLNITAPNPTGRRYSSQMPLTTGEGSAGAIGGDGERILASDLRLPNNNAPDQRQCVCGMSGSVPGGCNLCLAHAPQIATYRIPDFVGRDFIAEAKNVRQLLVTHTRDYQQISEIAAAAGAAGLPFYLYVRVDTLLDPAYHALFEGIKGGIIFYFAVPGYVDPLDRLAHIGLLIVLILVAVWLLSGLLSRAQAAADDPSPPPAQSKAAPNPLSRADEAEAFYRRARDRTRRRIDSRNPDNDKLN